MLHIQSMALHRYGVSFEWLSILLREIGKGVKTADDKETVLTQDMEDSLLASHERRIRQSEKRSTAN
jgi:hypothetical protein